MPDARDDQPASAVPSSDAAFSAAMVHLYRGEMNRMTVWRQRLDITTNWAILLTFGLTTFTLGSPDVPHYILLLGLALIGISIMLEGRRYRHLHHSKWRLYLLEFGFFGELLQPPARETISDWRGLLANELRHPRFDLGWIIAMRARLRRNYLLLIYFITGVWLSKLFIHPDSPTSPAHFFTRFAVGDLIPPWFVAATATLFVGGATVLALTCPPAEVLEDWSERYVRVRLHPGGQPGG